MGDWSTKLGATQSSALGALAPDEETRMFKRAHEISIKLILAIAATTPEYFDLSILLLISLAVNTEPTISKLISML